MECTATLKYGRISPRKARLVADLVRGMKADEAMSLLFFTPKKAAAMIRKILESAIGNASQATGVDEDKLFIPWSTFQALYGHRYVDDFVFRPYEGLDSERVIDRVYEALARRFRFAPDDREALHIWDTLEMEKMFNALFYGMRIFLGIVGSFTLIVGGIGISNIMNVVIEERTREIGVKMALGAKRRFILWQFVAETLTITAVGGVIGFVVAWGLVSALPAFRIEEYVGTPRVSSQVAAVAVTLLALVGLASGYFPARRAASLQPVQALKP